MSELEVRKLLDKYWEGETSLEEEAKLRSYFSEEDVADEFLPFQAMFTFFSNASSMRMEAEIPQPAIKQLSEDRPATKIRSLGWWRAAAAAVVLAIGLFFINRQMVQTQTIETYTYQDTFEDPELAYAEFKRMMAFVSSKMNKGVNKASQGLDKIETLTDIIN